MTITAAHRRLFWFVLVGALSTVLQTAVYLLVREVEPATWASWTALLVVTPLNTEAHRRLTFDPVPKPLGRLHGEAGLTSLVIYLANTATAPWSAGLLGAGHSPLTEALVLALTGSLIGGARYILLRNWVFSTQPHSTGPQSTHPQSTDRPGADRPGTPAPVTPAPMSAVRHVVAGRRCRRDAGWRRRRARRAPAGRRR